jgi:hypothetical protein
MVTEVLAGVPFVWLSLGVTVTVTVSPWDGLIVAGAPAEGEQFDVG